MLAVVIVTLVLVCFSWFTTIGLTVYIFYAAKETRQLIKQRVDDSTASLKANQTILARDIQELKETLKRVQSPSRKNDIEKREPEEIPVDETMRIPIVSGMNVRYEDEDESYPVDLLKYGQTEKDIN